VDTRKWPRKNDAESINARQEALGLDGEVTGIELEPWARAQEMLTGVAVIPVSVVGPVELELGEYELREPGGELAETGRARDTVFVPLAHTEGGLSASLYRGARAVAESGGFRTFVLADRITRASCFVFTSAGEAVAFSRWLEGELDSILEPRKQVMQLRRFDLQPPFLGARALGKDVQDQLGPVDHLDVELFLQVALLPRGQLLVEDQQVEVRFMLERTERLPLALPDEERGVGVLPPLRLGADHSQPRGARELSQLEHLLFDLGQSLPFVVKGHQVGTFRRAVGIPDQLASLPMIAGGSRPIAASRSSTSETP